MKTLGEVKAVKYIVINGTADGFLKADGSIDTTAYSNYTSSLGITLVGKDFRPVYGSGANQIAQGNDSRINNGQTAHGWGNHATQGYIKTFTDTTYVGSTTITLGAGNSFQRAALTGDVTSPANSNVTTIADNAVTSAKIATNAVTFVELTTIPTKTLIGRFATGTGDAQNITLGSNISIDATGVLNSVNTNNTYTGSTSISLSGISFQRAALTGDVTAALNDNTTTIAANAITTPKILNNAVTSEKIATNAVTFVELTTIPTKTLVGRFATGTGDAQNITLGSNLSIDATGVLNSINTAYTGSTSIGLVAGSFQRAALTGDVTSPVNSNVTTIGTSTVNFNKLQNINTQRLLGRGTAGVGDIQELTLGANLTLSTAGVLSSSDTTYTLAGLGGLPLAGGIMTGVIDLNRNNGGANTGLAWWTGTYKAWRTYMSTVGAGQGPVGITPPVGQLVTTYALRNYIEDSAGYGWTFEAGTAQSTTPTIKAEIRSSDGAARFGSISVYGGLASGFLKANGTIDSTGYMATTHVANAITTANITSWNDKFKSLKMVANLDVVSESGIYRQEGPANAYPYSATLNLNSSDGRAQLMMNRAGSGMIYRTSTSGTTGTSWTSWITVFDTSNLNPQLFLNKNTDNIVDASTFKISNNISPNYGKFEFTSDYPVMSYGDARFIITDESKAEFNNLMIVQDNEYGSNTLSVDTYFTNNSKIHLINTLKGSGSSQLTIYNYNYGFAADLNGDNYLTISPDAIVYGLNSQKAIISNNYLTANRNYELPNQSGTIALLSDIPIPSIGNFVTVDTIQTVTGSKTFELQINTTPHGNSSQWKSAFDWGNHAAFGVGSSLGADYTSSGTQKPNNTVFGSGKLKLQMLGGSNLSNGVTTSKIHNSTWNDVLYMSAYTGADVKQSNALIMSKINNTIGFAQQNFDSTIWGPFNEIWHSGNSNPKESAFFQSTRDFPLGTLITTSINYGIANGDAFLLEIKGNSYGSLTPFNIMVQGYIYSNTITNSGGITTGIINTIKAINIGGNLCFWFPSKGYWQGFDVFCASTMGAESPGSRLNASTNRVISVLNSAEPAGTKKIDLTLKTLINNTDLAIVSNGTTGIYLQFNGANISGTELTALQSHNSDLLAATFGNYAGFINTAGTANGNPTSDWFFRIKMLHNNSNGYYSEIAVGMTGSNSMWYKRFENNGTSGWVRVLDVENGMALNLPGTSTAIKTFKSLGGEYHNSGIIAEGNGTTIDPTIGFHQPGIRAGLIKLAAGIGFGGGNTFEFRSNPASNFAPVKALSFIKEAGTSTQVLLADGNVKELSTFASGSTQTLAAGASFNTGQELTISGGNTIQVPINFIQSRDSALRNPDTFLPSEDARSVRFDFANSSLLPGATGNYAGVMTYRPWDGTSTSTGDSSYQLAFCNHTGINGTGLPGLKIRKGIDSTWFSWFDIIHTGTYGSSTSCGGSYVSSSAPPVGSRLKIILPFTMSVSTMVSFTIKVYGAYKAYEINVSGYLYGATDNWYLPNAQLISMQGQETSIVVYMGKNPDGKAYVSIPRSDYMGVGIFNIVGAFNEKNWGQGWILTEDSSTPNIALTKTVFDDNVNLTTVQTITGAKTFSSALTAQSFVKTGGTANDILMANGTTILKSSITGTTYAAGTLAEINAGTNATRVWTPLILRDSLVTLGTVQTITGVKTFSGALTAQSFLESSLRSVKKNIELFKKSGTQLVNELKIVTFDRNDNLIKNKIGIIADDSPKEFLSETKDSVDLYKTTFIQAKAIQELIEENKKLKEELHNLRELVMSKLDKL